MTNKQNIFATLKTSETVFEFITKMMALQKSQQIILKERGASNTRELGELYTKWSNRKD